MVKFRPLRTRVSLRGNSDVQRVPEWTEARKLFRSLMEISGLLGWICDADGYCIYMSTAWHKYTGSPDGLGLGWLNAVHPEDRLKAHAAYFEANHSRAEYQVDYRLERSEGGYALAWARGVPHFDPAGRYSGMFGITNTTHDFAEQASFIRALPNAPKPKVLSDRERQVLELFARGFTIETAAVQLGIAEATVAHHAKNATHKLGALNRTQAVVKAIQLSELEITA